MSNFSKNEVRNKTKVKTDGQENVSRKIKKSETAIQEEKVESKMSKVKTSSRQIKKSSNPLDVKSNSIQSSYKSNKETLYSSNPSSVKVNSRTSKVESSKVSNSFKNTNKVSSSQKKSISGVSNRSTIVKTKYFPSKNMISNVVREKMKERNLLPEKGGNTSSHSINQKVNVKPGPSRSVDQRSQEVTEKHRTTKQAPTLSEIKRKAIREMKMKKMQDQGSDFSKNKSESTEENVERPRTAILERGNVINANLVKSEELSFPTTNSDVDDQYEDDFESYESDFERYTSSSSNLSVSEAPATSEPSSDDLSFTDESKKTVTAYSTDEERKLDSGHFDLSEIRHKQLLANIQEFNKIGKMKEVIYNSLSDEGYEEDKTSLQGKFYNFINAQKKQALQETLKRGEEILSMIKLDKSFFTLYEMSPVPYENFIRIYGCINSVQISTQTTENEIDESIQTDTVVCKNKWTQAPVAFSVSSVSLNSYKNEYLGVGDDINNVGNYTYENVVYNEDHLRKFLTSSSRVVSAILNERSNNFSQKTKVTNKNIPFSASSVKVDLKEFEILESSSVVYICVSKSNSFEFLTVHRTNTFNKFRHEDLICIWNAVAFKYPQKILGTAGHLTCADFGYQNSNLVFGGALDGSIKVWNSENERYFSSSSGESKFNVTVPAYMSKIGSGHNAKVVSVCSVPKNSNLKPCELDSNEKVSSLDEEGVLIFWGVVVRGHHTLNSSMEEISLVQSSTLHLCKTYGSLLNLECKGLSFNSLDPSHFFVITNYGYIIHCLESGNKPVPRKYNSGGVSRVNTLDTCPFSKLYFVVGYQDGSIALFSRNVEQPLMTLENNGKEKIGGIDFLQWSVEKPCIFYGKDDQNVIHIWNLTLSDIFPIYSIPFKQNIDYMKLSNFKKASDGVKSYMILAADDGQLWLYFLNNEHKSHSEDEYENDIKYFFNYVNRL